MTSLLACVATLQALAAYTPSSQAVAAAQELAVVRKPIEVSAQASFDAYQASWTNPWEHPLTEADKAAIARANSHTQVHHVWRGETVHFHSDWREGRDTGDFWVYHDWLDDPD